MSRRVPTTTKTCGKKKEFSGDGTKPLCERHWRRSLLCNEESLLLFFSPSSPPSVAHRTHCFKTHPLLSSTSKTPKSGSCFLVSDLLLLHRSNGWRTWEDVATRFFPTLILKTRFQTNKAEEGKIDLQEGAHLRTHFFLLSRDVGENQFLPRLVQEKVASCAELFVFEIEEYLLREREREREGRH